MSRSTLIKDSMIGKRKLLLFHTELCEGHWIMLCVDKDSKIYEKVLTSFINDDDMPVWCNINKLTCREQRPTEEEWCEWLEDEYDEKHRIGNPT